MISRVLGLVDGSPCLDSVCHHAAWAASRLRVGVDLLHVFGGLGASSSIAASSSNVSAFPGLHTHAAFSFGARPDEEHKRLSVAAGRSLLDYASRALEREGTKPLVQRLWEGSLPRRVVSYFAEFASDLRLVVMGKNGRGRGLGSEHLGSNVERIVRTSHLPILVASRAIRPIQRVAVAVDGSAGLERLVAFVSRSPLFADLEVTLIHAGPEVRDLRVRMDGAVQQLKMSGVAAKGEIVSGTPASVLGRKIDEHTFDLMVMGGYSHSRLHRRVVGSTTSALIQASHVPVLVCGRMVHMEDAR